MGGANQRERDRVKMETMVNTLDGAFHPEEVELVVEVMRSEDGKKRPLDDTNQTAVECFMCASSNVKYRCPRCEQITCSLACCVEHKKKFDCDGKRDRTKFIPTKQFTDSDLSSDFFFLEEISRSTNSAARSRSQLGVNVKRYGQHKPQQKKRRVGSNPESLAHVAFQLLVQHAAKRGVALTLLAPGMSKRVRNTSYMNTKESRLYWRIEWSFPSADVPVSLSEERADDSLTPFELLDKYLERRPENTSLRSKLNPYATPTWRNDVVLLLRKEFTASPQPQYYRLDGNLSLESNLKRKAVVEFPVITVVVHSEVAQYAIVNDLIEVIGTLDQPHVDPNEPNEAEEDVGNGNEDEEELVEEGIDVEKDDEDLTAPSSPNDVEPDTEMVDVHHSNFAA